GWGDAELWAYLKLHDLPIHPAYAMTMGGTLDRSRIRVHSFGGEDGAINGRLAWEDHYYGDITARLEGVTRARPARRNRRPPRRSPRGFLPCRLCGTSVGSCFIGVCHPKGAGLTSPPQAFNLSARPAARMFFRPL